MSEPILLFAQLFIYISLLVFTIYTVILGYHWFSYGASRKTSMSAMIVFLVGAAGLFITLVMAYQFL